MPGATTTTCAHHKRCSINQRQVDQRGPRNSWGPMRHRLHGRTDLKLAEWATGARCEVAAADGEEPAPVGDIAQPQMAICWIDDELGEGPYIPACGGWS